MVIMAMGWGFVRMVEGKENRYLSSAMTMGWGLNWCLVVADGRVERNLGCGIEVLG
jgi:hypothetical protein